MKVTKMIAFDIHIEFDEQQRVTSMTIVQDGGDVLTILSNQNVGFNTTNPQGKLQVLDCPMGIGDPPGSLPNVVQIQEKDRTKIKLAPDGQKAVPSAKELGVHGIGSPDPDELHVASGGKVEIPPLHEFRKKEETELYFSISGKISDRTGRPNTILHIGEQSMNDTEFTKPFPHGFKTVTLGWAVRPKGFAQWRRAIWGTDVWYGPIPLAKSLVLANILVWLFLSRVL